MMTETLKNQKALIDAGFSESDIASWQVQQRQALSDAGYNQAQIDTEFGEPPLDPKPAAKAVRDNIEKAIAPEAVDGEPKPVKDFMEALDAGFQGSITGLLKRGKVPDKTLAEDAPMASRIAGSIGTLAGDIPAMVGGAILGGGNPITGTAGAFALPAGLRKVITDAYEKGEATNWGEFWERASGAIIETAKGYVTGAATGAAGKLIGAAPIASPTAKAAATLSGEVATMVTVGKALEGEVPSANDFIDAAVIVGGAKGAVKTAKKLRDVYSKAGVKPDEFIADTERDVTIGQDFVAENLEVPRVYGRFDSPESIAAETMPPVADGMVRVFRGESTERLDIPDWVKEGIEANGSMDAEGRWWTTNPEIADWYVKDAGDHGRMVYQDVPEEVVQSSKVSALPEVIQKFSLDPESELFLPKEFKGKGAPVPATASGSSGGKKPPRGESVNDQIRDIADELGQPYPEESPEAARAKMLSKISVRESNDKEPMTFQKLYTDLIDDLNPIREAVKKAAKDGELPTSDDPYQLARLTRGTFGKANQFLEYGTFDFKTYENNGPSLRDILQGKVRDLPEITDAEPVDLDTLRAYIKAKRDLELVSRGVADPDVDVDAATQVVKHWGHYERVAKELTAYQNRLTAYLRDAGIISRDDYDAMLKANKDYVPFFRVMDEDVGGAGLGRGVKTKNPIKSIKGSERNIIDPIESIIKNTYMYLSLAERNAVGAAFVNMANKSGNPGMFMKKLPPEFKATTLKEEEIRALFDEFVTIRKQTSTERATATRSSTESKTETTGGEGAEPQTKQGKMVRDRVLEALSARGFSKGESEQMVARLEGKASGGSTTTDSRTTVETLVKEIEKTEYIPELNIRLPNSVATIFRAVKTPLKDNEIAVFENGKYQKYQVDKEVAEAFNAADSQTAGLLTKILAIPAKMLRAGAVLSPDFMGRNMIRDQTMAFVLSKGGYFPVFDFMRGAFSLAKKDADFQNWLKSGGANAALVSMDREYLQLQLDTLTEVQGVARKAWNVATRPFEMLRITSELIENATRLGEFKRVSGGLTEKAAIQEGGMASREVTVDFARIGAKTRAMSLISAFFNAAVQGEERVIRAFAENPVGVTTKMMTAITLPSILLYLSNREDPRWQEIPRWQKDLFWIVFTDDHIYRIPKPHSAGIMFGSLPERMLEAYESDHPGAMKDLEKSILSTFIPNMIPTVAAPIVDQFANRSLFTGAPLIPAAQEKMLPEYQYTEYTTETAKAIGQIMGAFPGMRDRSIRDEDTFIGGVARALTTPILVENYVRSWTGGLGMYTLQLADKALREAGALPDPVKPLDTLSDLPVIKAFVVRYPSASAQSIQDFYDDYYAKKRLYDTKMALAKEGDIDAFERVQQIDPTAWDEMAGIRDTITDQAKLIRLIYKNPDMTPEDKRQIIDTTYGRMIELAKVGNEAMRDLEKLLGEQ